MKIIIKHKDLQVEFNRDEFSVKEIKEIRTKVKEASKDDSEFEKF